MLRLRRGTTCELPCWLDGCSKRKISKLGARRGCPTERSADRHFNVGSFELTPYGNHAPTWIQDKDALCPIGTFPRRASLVSGKNAGVPHIPRCRRPLADNRVSRLDL